jgi:hypothetical protein
MFEVDLEKAAAVLDGMMSEGRLYSAMSGLMAVTRSQLAG